MAWQESKVPPPAEYLPHANVCTHRGVPGRWLPEYITRLPLVNPKICACLLPVNQAVRSSNLPGRVILTCWITQLDAYLIALLLLLLLLLPSLPILANRPGRREAVGILR